MAIRITDEEKALAILTAAREKLTPEGAWIQGNYAGVRDGNGAVTVARRSMPANCWCASGAIRASNSGRTRGINAGGILAFRYLANAVSKRPSEEEMGAVVRWNDGKQRTKEEVLAGFDKAILIAKERVK